MMSRRCTGVAEVLDGVLAASQPARSSAAPSPAAHPMATMAEARITAATDIQGRVTAMRLPIMAAAMDRVTPMDRVTVMGIGPTTVPVLIMATATATTGP